MKQHYSGSLSQNYCRGLKPSDQNSGLVGFRGSKFQIRVFRKSRERERDNTVVLLHLALEAEQPNVVPMKLTFHNDSARVTSSVRDRKDGKCTA